MPILRQLDRLIRYHEFLNVEYMQIADFIYTNTAMSLVLAIFEDNEKNPEPELFFNRMCFVLSFYGNPVDIYDARLVPLRATRGFRVIIGAVTHTFTLDTYNTISLSQWWSSKHKDNTNTISDKLRVFGINHLVTIPDDWYDILEEQEDVFEHTNPLLCLFTNQLWLPADSNEKSEEQDYAELKVRAKECVEYLYSRLIGEFDVNVLDINHYLIATEDGFKAEMSSSTSTDGIKFHIDLTAGATVKKLSVTSHNVQVDDIRNLVWEFIATVNTNNWSKQLTRIGIEDMFE